MELADFTAVLDELTKNTYVLIVVHDPTIGECGAVGTYGDVIFIAAVVFAETAALKLNIRSARTKFEELQRDSLSS